MYTASIYNRKDLMKLKKKKLYIVKEFGTDMYTLLYLKWITNKGLLHSTWSFAQCYVAAWMGEEFGGKRIHAYVWLRPFAVLKLSHC